MRNTLKQSLVAVPTAAVISLGAFSPVFAEETSPETVTECAPGYTFDTADGTCVLTPSADETEVPIEEPVAQQPVTDEPATDEPATDEPAPQDPEQDEQPAPEAGEQDEESAPGADTVGTAEEIDAVFDGINAAREAQGLAPVTFNITLSKANQAFLNDFLIHWTDSTVDPYVGTQIGWTNASMSMSYSHQGGLAGVLEAVEAMSVDEASGLLSPETTYVGVAVAHPGNPGVDEETGQSIPATYITASFFDYPADQQLPGSHADAADAYAGYTPAEVSPFKDVPTHRVFYKEMSWLAESGISKGWTAADGTKTYRPDSSVSRDVMAAFLYRWNGSPEYTAPETSRFRDVSTRHVFYKEMNWLADQGISNGWTAADGTKTYQPDSKIHRDQMAAFLYRLAAIDSATPLQK